MRTSLTHRCLQRALCFAALLTIGQTGMTDEPADTPGIPPEYAKNDKLQQTTGPEHAEFLKRVGTWNVTMKFNEMFGGATDRTVVKARAVLGGKFLVEEGKGTQMGQRVTTMSVLGYDTLTKEYSIVNMNSAYTSMYPMTGKKRDDGVIEYKGVMKDAMSPEGRSYRAEEKTINDNKTVITVFDGEGDKEFVVFTMTYERSTEK